jgi:hypothetical protein
MAGGKKFKFAGSTIAIVTEFGADSPSKAITGITKANPAVVTSANHGLTTGDVIKITGVVGMTEVNDEVFIVERLTANTFELVDTDSTGYGAWTANGSIDEAAFSNFCELTNYNRQGGSKSEIETTSLCSTAKEYEVGLPDFGTTQIDFNFAPQTAIQLAMATFDRSGDKMAVKVTLPKSGGIRTLLGFIQQTSEQAGADGHWTGSLTIRNTGAPYDQAA